MTKQQLLDLIAQKVRNQGNEGALDLADILEAIVDKLFEV